MSANPHRAKTKVIIPWPKQRSENIQNLHLQEIQFTQMDEIESEARMFQGSASKESLAAIVATAPALDSTVKLVKLVSRV